MLINSDFQVVSRLGDDAILTYIIEPQKTGKPSRPKTIGDRVYFSDLSLFELISCNEKEIVHTAVVKSKSLKRPLRILYVQYLKTGAAKIYFSTDTKMDAVQILDIYQTRFQIEFLYRDAKQHTGLTNCQARSIEKLDFHFNASLTAVNLAKNRVLVQQTQLKTRCLLNG